jgi:hypothetical protein
MHTQFVLKETVSGKYLQRMTLIGPMLTDKVEDAEHFDDRMQAVRHPAHDHLLCIFEIEEVGKPSHRPRP